MVRRNMAYEMVTSNDPTNKMILDNMIFLMIPSFNPDGQIMIDRLVLQVQRHGVQPHPSSLSLPSLYRSR